jgi:cell fate regulator YaaT (PSP1 superfamily)
MSDSYDEHISEADLRRLEDPVATEAAPRVKGSVAFELPDPLYRIKLEYSSETVLASFDSTEVLGPNSAVILPTRHGLDLGLVLGTVRHPGYVAPDDIVVLARVATEEDKKRRADHVIRERESFKVCQEKIVQHKLDMKLVATHYLLEEPKVLFFFTAESRVDFRELVKDLVSVFKMRIELRQIGVRDESRVLGGLGVCGRCYCCHCVTDKLNPVSIKMAKDQNLSLNSMKISGPCGRLLCCLSYEFGFYREEKAALPPEGARFSYDGSSFKITEINVLGRNVRLSSDDGRQIDLPFGRFAKSDGRWAIVDEQ